MTKQEKSFPTEIQTRLQGHVETSAHYFDNALAMLAKGEDRKAAEMLWGAASQMVKALGLAADVELRSHGAIRKFVYEGPARGDLELMRLFRDIESLHVHFYDARLEHAEVEQISGETRAFIESLRTLLYDRIGPPANVSELVGGAPGSDAS